MRKSLIKWTFTALTIGLASMTAHASFEFHQRVSGLFSPPKPCSSISDVPNGLAKLCEFSGTDMQEEEFYIANGKAFRLEPARPLDAFCNGSNYARHSDVLVLVDLVDEPIYTPSGSFRPVRDTRFSDASQGRAVTINKNGNRSTYQMYQSNTTYSRSWNNTTLNRNYTLGGEQLNNPLSLCCTQYSSGFRQGTLPDQEEHGLRACQVNVPSS